MLNGRARLERNQWKAEGGKIVDRFGAHRTRGPHQDQPLSAVPARGRWRPRLAAGAAM